MKVLEKLRLEKQKRERQKKGWQCLSELASQWARVKRKLLTFHQRKVESFLFFLEMYLKKYT